MRNPSDLPECQYPKLVRDKMPEIIQRDNCVPVYSKLEDHGVLKLDALYRKLKEETAELEDAMNNGSLDDIRNELADLTEVIRQIGFEYYIDPVDVDMERVNKANRRGGFKMGIYMLGVINNECK